MSKISELTDNTATDPVATDYIAYNLDSPATKRRNLYPWPLPVSDAAIASRAAAVQLMGSTYGLRAIPITGQGSGVWLGPGWEDLRVSGSQFRLGSAGYPNLGTFGTGDLQALLFQGTATAATFHRVFFEIQMPHAWRVGTNIYPHVHYAPVDNFVGNVYWEFLYQWRGLNEDYGADEAPLYSAHAAGGSAWRHRLASFAPITPGTQGISSMLVCRLSRRADNALDTYNGRDVALLEFDIHYQVDSFGSDQETAKNF